MVPEAAMMMDNTGDAPAEVRRDTRPSGDDWS